MEGKQKDLGGRSNALDLWGDLDGFQTVGGSSNRKLGGNVCVCVCVTLVMALINSQSRVCHGGVWGLSRKAVKPFKSHKVLGQSKPPPARHLMSSTLCVCKCKCNALCTHPCA